MYQIKQEEQDFVVCCRGKEIQRFSTEEAATEFLIQKTQYPTKSDEAAIIIE